VSVKKVLTASRGGKGECVGGNPRGKKVWVTDKVTATQTSRRRWRGQRITRNILTMISVLEKTREMKGR